MKIIALEEHFVTPALARAQARQPVEYADTEVAVRVQELGEVRLRNMAATGVDVQVLSPAPGVQGLEPDEAVSLARELNDVTAETIQRWPGRFEGFAVLPTPDPAQAARTALRCHRHVVADQHQHDYRQTSAA